MSLHGNDDHKTVFFFEDHQDVADKIRKALERPPVKPDYPILKVKYYPMALPAIKAIETWSSPLPNVAVLDVEQDDYKDAGIEICKTISKFWRGFPVMFLSRRDQIADRIRGLEVGAVKYLSKRPIQEDEEGWEEVLRAEVNALLTIGDPSEAPDEYYSGSLYVNVDTHETRWQEKRLRLNKSQMGIVDELAQPKHAGTVRSYDDLARAAGISKPLNKRQLRINMRQHIYQIRGVFDKVDEEFHTAWGQERYGIISVEGRGYRWMPDGTQLQGQSDVMRDKDGSERNGKPDDKHDS